MADLETYVVENPIHVFMLSFNHLPSITTHFVPGITKPREHRDKPDPVLDLVRLWGQEGVRLVNLVLQEE